MKHEITSLNTKKALASSLKKLMQKKAFSKITVSEIIADCGVNRKTFYYHFEDIYALLKWMFEQEAIEVVKQFDLLVDYEEAILFVIDYAEENKHILNCAYDSLGEDGLKRFFYSDFIGVAQSVIAAAEKELGVQVEEDFEHFLSQIYAEALAGILIRYFKDETIVDPKAILNYVSLFISTSLPSVLLAKAASETAKG